MIHPPLTMKFRFPALLALLVICINTSAQKATAPTWLWKISGNGLKKDSYIFISLPSLDRRLVTLPDSVYYYLNKSNGVVTQGDMVGYIEYLIDQKYTTTSTAEVDTAVKFNDEPPPPPPPVKLPGGVEIKPTRREDFNALDSLAATDAAEAWLYKVARHLEKPIQALEDLDATIEAYERFKELNKNNGYEAYTLPENITQLYLASDWTGLGKLVMTGDNDEYIRNLNLKLQTRIDGFIQDNSQFIVIDAPYAIGENGVLELLRKKGYQLQPIVGRKTIPKESYEKTLPPLKWVQYADESETFSIELPRPPKTEPANSSSITCVEPAVNAAFLVSSKRMEEDADLDTILESLGNELGHPISYREEITFNGMKGVEGMVIVNRSITRIRFLKGSNMMYIVMAAIPMGNPFTPEIERYFNSFRPVIQEESASKGWKTFAPKGKGIEMKFPRAYKRNRDTENAAEGTDWTYFAHDCLDLGSGTFYLVNIRELRPGFYLPTPTAVYAEIEKSMEGNMTPVEESRMEDFQGYPCYSMKGQNEFGIYSIKLVARGNRIYQFIIGTSNTKNADAIVGEFMGNVKLLPTDNTDYSLQDNPKLPFRTFAPEPFVVKSDSTQLSNGQAYYLSFDKNRIISYEILAEAIPAYAWNESETGYLESLAQRFIIDGDSIISKTQINDGQGQSLYWHTRREGRQVDLRLRSILTRDSIYTLISYVHPEDGKLAEKAVYGFKLRKYTPGNITVKKTTKLLNDLQSKDPATREKARTNIAQTSFEKKDLPTIHKLLLKSFPDDTLNIYQGTRSYLADAASVLQDASSIQFVKEQYPKFNNDPRTQYHLLQLLSAIHTKESYQHLKDILTLSMPKQIESFALNLSWYDSIELSRTLFPEILSQVENPTISDQLINLTDYLLRVEYLSPSDLTDYHEGLLAVARKKAAVVSRQREEEVSFYDLYASMRILGVAEDSTLNNALREFLPIQLSGVRMHAGLLLMDKGKEIEPQYWESVGADIYFRRDLYDSLSARNRMDLFPQKYLTQEMMAASDMYNYASDEIRPNEVELLEEREITIDGVKKRIYIYTITFLFGNSEVDPEVERELYLGIVGLYEFDKSNMDCDRTTGDMIFLEHGLEHDLSELIDALIERKLNDRRNQEKEEEEN